MIIKYQDGQEDKTTVSYNALPVKLPGRKHPLFLVVVKGFGKVPMMLLTSCPVNLKSKECIWRIVEIYLTRWKCDESFRIDIKDQSSYRECAYVFICNRIGISVRNIWAI